MYEETVFFWWVVADKHVASTDLAYLQDLQIDFHSKDFSADWRLVYLKHPLSTQIGISSRKGHLVKEKYTQWI